jgi:hypothetical protein
VFGALRSLLIIQLSLEFKNEVNMPTSFCITLNEKEMRFENEI